MTANLLTGLNPQQHDAVTTGEGAVLVLAGPGSGKTGVLTRRIAFLISEMGVNPRNVMAVTFTNKAAGEMRHRVEGMLENRLRGLQIGTFHSTCARLLRIESEYLDFNEDYVIYDTDDQRNVIQQAMSELNLDQKRYSPRAVLGAIGNAKNELILPADYVATDYFTEIVSRVYPRYQIILADSNAMDFDDLLIQMVLLLQNNPHVREKYQNRYDFVLVDEFQDTNTVQYQLVKLFGAPRNNIFVVGDEDQAIYAFRGADYRNVLRFREDYPDCKVILLEQNYRSYQPILDVARAVINRNPNRTEKSLFTDKSGGTKVMIQEAYNENYEAQYILEQIHELRRKDGFDYNDFAVMYRTNAQSRAIEQTCINEGVPYVLVGGVGFYKRREVKDILSYLRLVNNPNDTVSFARIINVPKRGIGKSSLQKFQHWAASENYTYGEALDHLLEGMKSPLGSRAKKLFAEFGLLLQEWRNMTQTGNLLNLFDSITARTGYNLYLSSISKTPEEAIDRADNVREFRGLIQQADEDEMSLTEFLVEQSLVADVDALDENSDAITLLTLHSAKGLEYPVVFLAGVEQGLLPHFRSVEDPDGIEEERRLMYVGVTRAMERLYMTYAFRRSLYGNSEANRPSEFLADIPAELLDGSSTTLNNLQERQSYQWQTTWNTPSSRLSRDLKQARQEQQQPRREPNEKIRSKIIPFPDSKPTQFKQNDRVSHPLYGHGTVIESKFFRGSEEVTVAFVDKRFGIKRLFADSANLTILE